jgi:hypothetical protein
MHAYTDIVLLNEHPLEAIANKLMFTVVMKQQQRKWLHIPRCTSLDSMTDYRAKYYVPVCLIKQLHVLLIARVYTTTYTASLPLAFLQIYFSTFFTAYTTNKTPPILIKTKDQFA